MMVVTIQDGDYSTAAITAIVALIGIVVLVKVFQALFNRIRNVTILKKGKSCVGYFENAIRTNSKNNVRYRITFSYADEDGIPRTARSLRTYSRWQADCIQDASIFGIKVLKGVAAIDIKRLYVNSAPKTVQEIFCTHCGVQLEKDCGINCPTCGAVI